MYFEVSVHGWLNSLFLWLRWHRQAWQRQLLSLMVAGAESKLGTLWLASSSPCLSFIWIPTLLVGSASIQSESSPQFALWKHPQGHSWTYTLLISQSKLAVKIIHHIALKCKLLETHFYFALCFNPYDLKIIVISVSQRRPIMLMESEKLINSDIILSAVWDVW